MLDAALRVLHRDAAAGLVSLLSVEKVAREAALPATARRDWEGARGAGLLTALADERLNALRPAGAGEITSTVLRDFPDTDDGDFAAWFLAAMSIYHETGLRRPSTIPSLLLNVAAATSSDLPESGPSSNSIAANLADGRRRYYDDLTASYTALFDTVLDHLGRRPKAGIDTALLIKLNQAIHEGALMRRYLEPDAFGPDGALVVAQAQLAIVLALTEPVHEGRDFRSDPASWILGAAPTVASDPTLDRVTCDVVIARLGVLTGGTIGPDLLLDLLRQAYPTDIALWDVALRWCLAAVAAAIQVRGIRSDEVVLKIVLHQLRDVAKSHPGLIAALCADGLPVEASYTATLVASVEDLLESLGAPDPVALAPRLVELALLGHYDVLSTLLEATMLPTPPGGWA